MEDRTVTQPVPEAEALTQVILAIFRTNGLVLSAGDRLSGTEGLTSARWQVLGAIALARRPLTVPQIARRMGLTRQSVHATCNRLIAEGHLEFVPNVDHRRSQLARLTEKGTSTFRVLMAKQETWAERLALGLELSDLETTAHMLGVIGDRLQIELQDQRKGGDDEDRT